MTDVTVYRIATIMDMLCNRYRIPAKHIMSDCGPCGARIVVIRHGCGSACLSESPDQIVPRMAYNCIYVTRLTIKITSRVATIGYIRVRGTSCMQVCRIVAIPRHLHAAIRPIRRSHRFPPLLRDFLTSRAPNAANVCSRSIPT
jgi:hypothetical protein